MIPASDRRLTRAPLILIVAALLAALVVLTGGAGAARAQAPMRMTDQIVDTVGVFSAADHDRISAAIDALYNEKNIQMWVAYVDSFDGLPREDWARQTEELSELGDRDVLLAVATADRSYQLTSTSAIDDLTVADLKKVATETLQPELKARQWGASAVDTITALNTAAGGGSSGGAVAAGVVGALVVLGGGGFLYLRRRRRNSADQLDALREHSDSLTVDQLAEQPLDVLHAWSREVLTDTDNAVKTSTDELTLAIGEFGAADAAPFTAALQAAQQALASSFALRQRLDDQIPETPDEQRSMLVQIITSCSDADALLDEQVETFDALRNLLVNAGSRLDELTRRVVEASTRVPRSQERLAALTERYGGTVVSSIAGNIGLAREQLQFAEDSIDQGRDALTLPAGRQGPVVADIRSAESALDTAGKLLDAIDSAEQTLSRARDGLGALLAEVRSEIAAADAALQAAPGRGTALDLAAPDLAAADLAAAAEKARAAVAVAEADGDTDPLRAFAGLSDADTDLDRALAAADAAAKEHSRTSQLVTNALETAEAKTQAAADFIETRRGAVGSVARTRLSRAQQLGSEAVALAETDADEALEKARQASRNADEALMAAQTDVVSWQDRQQPAARTAAGGFDSGAVLTGILVDSVLRGSMRSGSWPTGTGGYSAGGRSPGSFGGSSSSGRIGTGGRF